MIRHFRDPPFYVESPPVERGLVAVSRERFVELPQPSTTRHPKSALQERSESGKDARAEKRYAMMVPLTARLSIAALRREQYGYSSPVLTKCFPDTFRPPNTFSNFEKRFCEASTVLVSFIPTAEWRHRRKHPRDNNASPLARR